MKQIAIAIFSALFVNLALANDFPSLTEVGIGSPFPHPRADELSDQNRPTTQFKVPNYGLSKELFYEYQVAILNSSKKVVIASAEASFLTLSECQKSSEKLQQLVQFRFKGYKKAKGEEFNLTGVSTAYAKKGKNIFYTLNCIRRNGPFWILDFNIRGREEDKELNAAWQTFFSNRR